MSVAVIKIGGSVLDGPLSFRRAAIAIGRRLADRPDEKLVAVVSAEQGTTDALLAVARDIVEAPDGATLDLLWSTGEVRSTALLTLCLHAQGVRAVALNVHQTGLTEPDGDPGRGRARLRALRLRAALADHDVVVVPGFLAQAAGDRIVSLGRGGSDLTAVLLAAGLDADRCELIKDVPGYFSADPNADTDARHLPALTFNRAIEMADAGCELVQRHALDAARIHHLPLVVRALDGGTQTVIKE
jgi:aspartate kinase